MAANKLKSFLVILYCYGSIGLFSQANNVFNLIYDSGQEEAVFTILGDAGKLLLIGQHRDYTLDKRGLFISIYSEHGCLEDTKYYVLQDSTDILTIDSSIRTSDGGFLLCGIMVDGDFPGLFILPTQALLVKLNADMELEWWHTYGVMPDEDLERFRDVAELSDGYVAVGETYSYTVSGNPDAYMVKTDFEGNVVQEYHYDTGGDVFNALWNCRATSDTSFVISGGNALDTLSDSPNCVFFLEVDANLVIINEKKFINDALRLGGGRFLWLNNGSFLMSEILNYPDETMDTHLILVTSDWNTAFWESTIDINNEGDIAKAFLEMGNGDIIVFGHTKLDEFQPNTRYASWAAKFTPDGQHLWTKEFVVNEDTHWDQIYDAVITDNDEIFLAGYSISNTIIPGTNYANNNIWFVRMDTAGNIYKPLELIHNFIDDTIPVHQPYILPPYEAINGLPCYDYLWVVQDPDGLAISGPEEDNAFVPTKLGTYEFMLLVIDEEGSQVNATFNLFVTPATGMDDAHPLQHIIVIDHVIHHQCRVEISDNQIDRMVVYDINGRTVAHQAIESRSEISLNAANWSAGVYHFTAYNQKGELIEVVRAIKE